MEPRVTRLAAVTVASIIGGILLWISADRTTDAPTALLTLLAGTILLVAVTWVLLRSYQPGVDLPSTDEINIREWTAQRFLRYGREAAPLYLGIRLFVGWTWLTSGWGKATNPAWTQGGTALRGFWERAVATPEGGQAPIVYPAYRAFIQFMLDNQWYTWFGSLIAWGEILIGLGVLFGGLIGFAVVFALLMNFSFLFAGTVSSNPVMVLLELVLIVGWRTAGWWGIDRFLLPRIGTPWAPGAAASAPTVPSAPPPGAVPQRRRRR